MALSLFRYILAFLLLAFALISFVFSTVAITSREWALRNNYDPKLNTLDWKSPLYTLYRSPFVICSASLRSASGTQAGKNASDYKLNCHRFKPFGFGDTSCELAVATQNDTATNVGDNRLCQQIHLTGNFAITSTTFIGLAFVLTIILTLFATFGKRGESEHSEPTHQRDGHRKDGVVGGTSSPTSHPKQTKQNALGEYMALFALVCFAISVVAALISQFYAIIGLIQSAPNNSDFSSSTAGSAEDVNTHGSHGPWYQGKALSIYWTCSWGFALAASFLASRVWTFPSWK